MPATTRLSPCRCAKTVHGILTSTVYIGFSNDSPPENFPHDYQETSFHFATIFGHHTQNHFRRARVPGFAVPAKGFEAA